MKKKERSRKYEVWSGQWFDPPWYGHTRPVSDCEKAGSLTITEEEADEYLAADLTRFENAVNSYFTRTFNQNQFDAKYKWDKEIEDADITAKMLKYDKSGGRQLAGLTRRREAEVELFDTPVPE
ncbi:putative lysozyme [Blattamonas nauphoetae]|uniref:Lysozyme n=1 Tax=Blattamonas nauphoetae TaxID=2049346 RepID=A0ABQ9Y3H9_9EUKA|nr:putative lysozyme [Blattamonas nauphoetae]